MKELIPQQILFFLWFPFVEWKLILFNPNKAGLFEGSFFWEGINLTPPSYFMKNISDINMTIQLLNNLFKVYAEKMLTSSVISDVISFFNFKKSKILRKIDENSLYWQRNSSNLLNEFQWNFQERWKTRVSTSLYKIYIWKNPLGGGGFKWTPEPL